MKKILFTFLLFLVISNFNEFSVMAAYSTYDGIKDIETIVYEKTGKKPDAYNSYVYKQSDGSNVYTVTAYYGLTDFVGKNIVEVCGGSSTQYFIQSSDNTLTPITSSYKCISFWFVYRGTQTVISDPDNYSKPILTGILNNYPVNPTYFYKSKNFINVGSKSLTTTQVKQAYIDKEILPVDFSVLKPTPDTYLPDTDSNTEIDDGVSIGEINDLGSFLDSLKTGFGLLGDNGIVAFLKDAMNYLPESIMLLIFSGISAVVIVGVFKKLF